MNNPTKLKTQQNIKRVDLCLNANTTVNANSWGEFVCTKIYDGANNDVNISNEITKDTSLFWGPIWGGNPSIVVTNVYYATATQDWRAQVYNFSSSNKTINAGATIIKILYDANKYTP